MLKDKSNHFILPLPLQVTRWRAEAHWLRVAVLQCTNTAYRIEPQEGSAVLCRLTLQHVIQWVSI